MARARDIDRLRPDDRYRRAAAAIVSVRAREVFEQRTGVLDTGEIERVHDMRVATRRLRAALEVFGPCFPAREHRRALRDVKQLADALGERRDPDVHIEELEALTAASGEAERAAIAVAIERFRAEQAAANKALKRTLKDVERSRLRARLLRLAR